MEIKDIRQNCVQNTATRNILQTDDYQLNNNLAENAQDYRTLGMMAFNKLGDSCNVLFTIFLAMNKPITIAPKAQAIVYQPALRPTRKACSETPIVDAPPTARPMIVTQIKGAESLRPARAKFSLLPSLRF